MPNGTRKRAYFYGKSRTEVREKLTALIGELDRGLRVPADNWTVGAYLAYWLDAVVKPNRAPKIQVVAVSLSLCKLPPVRYHRRDTTLGRHASDFRPYRRQLGSETLPDVVTGPPRHRG